MTKKEIIEKLKNIQLTSEHILNEKIDKFDDELGEFIEDSKKEYGFLGFLCYEVEQAQEVYNTITEIINEGDK